MNTDAYMDEAIADRPHITRLAAKIRDAVQTFGGTTIPLDSLEEVVYLYDRVMPHWTGEEVQYLDEDAWGLVLTRTTMGGGDATLGEFVDDFDLLPALEAAYVERNGATDVALWSALTV